MIRSLVRRFFSENVINMFDFTGIGLRETIQKELDKNGVKTEGRDLAGRLSNYLLDSKAVNTNKKYFQSFKRF